MTPSHLLLSTPCRQSQMFAINWQLLANSFSNVHRSHSSIACPNDNSANLG